MFFPISAQKQPNKQTQAQGIVKICSFSALLVVNPGRGTTVVLHTHTKITEQTASARVFESSLQSCH